MKSNLIVNLLFLVSCVFSFGLQANSTDEIVSLSATEKIGFNQQPTVYIDLVVKKTRDLHVAIQNMDGWQTVKRTMKRIKKSGNYHFSVAVDGLKPGKYRVDAYLAPRGKNWADRLFQPQHAEFEVVDVANYVKTTEFSSNDQITFVDWPKQVVGEQEATLSVRYNITQARDLHIKLLNSDNWEEHAEIKVPVAEPGNFNLPLSHLINDFPTAKYAWVVFLTEAGGDEQVSEKYGKHFILADENKG